MFYEQLFRGNARPQPQFLLGKVCCQPPATCIISHSGLHSLDKRLLLRVRPSRDSCQLEVTRLTAAILLKLLLRPPASTSRQILFTHISARMQFRWGELPPGRPASSSRFWGFKYCTCIPNYCLMLPPYSPHWPFILLVVPLVYLADNNATVQN